MASGARTATLAVLSVLAVLAAGCAKGGKDVTSTATAATDQPALQGWVFDPALRPIAQANVTIASLGLSLKTSTDGHYVIEAPTFGVPLVLTVSSPGFITSSKGVQVEQATPVVLNFTMERVPVKKAYMEQLPFTGFLSCMLTTTLSGDDNDVDCGGDQNTRIWEFHVKEDLAGIVLEGYWEPRSPLANYLNITVETVGLGDQDVVLVSGQGPSVQRLQVSALQAAKYFPSGGTLRVTVSPGTNADDMELGSGAALALQQDVQLVESAFYVEGPPPTFTAVTQG